MKKYTITLTKVLGKDKYDKLVEYSFNKIREKFGNIKVGKAIKIAEINHQALMIISIFKAKNYEDDEIIKILHWNKEKSYKFIVANSFEGFVSIYKEYINLIIKYTKKS